MVKAGCPGVGLAPMDGVTDAAMRALQGELGAFGYAVTEFVRVSEQALPAKAFRRDIPELATGARTVSGLAVQVQLLGGDPDRMAQSAAAAVSAGATAIDINFGCPAPTVNRHDGGAALLRHPCRIFDIVHAVRSAVPPEAPVSAKLRLGWDAVGDIHTNAEMAMRAGADWITIHARTRVQGYRPPVFWDEVGRVRRNASVPVVANGDIWTRDDFRRCQEESGCEHFMLGRGALANPALPFLVAAELGQWDRPIPITDWPGLFGRLTDYIEAFHGTRRNAIFRMKQWMALAYGQGNFPAFQVLKHCTDTEACLESLRGIETCARA